MEIDRQIRIGIRKDVKIGNGIKGVSVKIDSNFKL